RGRAAARPVWYRCVRTRRSRASSAPMAGPSEAWRNVRPAVAPRDRANTLPAALRFFGERREQRQRLDRREAVRFDRREPLDERVREREEAELFLGMWSAWCGMRRGI